MRGALRQVWCGRRSLWLTGLLLTMLLVVRAEQLPVRTYTTADGLPRDMVTHIEQDSRGFIWMVAGDGLSRFDGYRFTNYTTDDGLPDRRVNDLLETRAGGYWIATDSGLCRFNPTGDRFDRLRIADCGLRNSEHVNPQSAIRNPQSEGPMFVVYNPPNGEKATAFNALLEDETGAIWCATSAGLYRLEVSAGGEAEFQFVDLGAPPESEGEKNTTVLMKDRKGFLWIGTWGGALYRLTPDGRVERYAGEYGLPQPQARDDRVAVIALLEDRDGQIWTGTRGLGLHQLVAEPAPARALVERTYAQKDGLPPYWINALLQTRDGRLWVATSGGVVYTSLPANGAGALRFQLYNAKNGLCDHGVSDIIEDRDGNLWVASPCGAIKVARNGFTGYGLNDGFNALFINSIFENRDGALLAINAPSTVALTNYTGRRINKFDGARFTSVEPNLPPHITYHGWGWWQTIRQDHTGEWWIPTGQGLYRFPKVERIEQLASVKQKAFYTMRAGLPAPEVFRVYEDARGDVWMATTGLQFGLSRWERATDSLHDHTAETGVPPKTDFTGFAEDFQGNLWIGTSEGAGLLRYRDGKFQRFTTADGVPPGWVIHLYVDRAGRLWVGSQLGGLNRIDDPGADTLRVVRYTTRDGLSSNNIRSITEDLWGRIYVGTGHGVDRLDLETGNVKHYTVTDGLPRGVIEHAYRDRHGALWFGSMFGLARFVPEQQESSTPPSIYLMGLRVDGVARRVSELGEMSLPSLDLASSQNQVSIDFIGLGASLGEELRYQYRLEGAADDWSAPTVERTINYANLAPGAYRFMVRAINADGRTSSATAAFSFNIAAPIWLRWWFWATVALALGLLALMFYRVRVARLLGVANMRTRIATDLHDDIGSGLSRMAILSEVVKQQMGATSQQSASLLTEIADSARTLVDSMRDIVWAIDPRRDDLSNVVFRVRQFASDVLEPQKIKLDFQVPSDLEKIKLDPEQRRHLYLIFKEAINNIARHADCDSVSLDITVSHNWLAAEIRDDGRGFSNLLPQQALTNGRAGGHGLENMQHRAAELGGHLSVDSAPGRGTCLRLMIPLKKR